MQLLMPKGRAVSFLVLIASGVSAFSGPNWKSQPWSCRQRQQQQQDQHQQHQRPLSQAQKKWQHNCYKTSPRETYRLRTTMRAAQWADSPRSYFIPRDENRSARAVAGTYIKTHTSPLFSTQDQEENLPKRFAPTFVLSIMCALLARTGSVTSDSFHFATKTKQQASRLLQAWIDGLRKGWSILLTAAIISTTLLLSPLPMSPAHASSTASAPVTTTTTAPATRSSLIESYLQRSSPSVDRMVDDYVQHYMFTDDQYDPIESIYREAYQDAAVGSYPKTMQHALQEIQSRIFGSEIGAGGSGILLGSSDDVVRRNFFRSLAAKLTPGAIYQSLEKLLIRRFGLNPDLAGFLLTTTMVVMAPIALLTGGVFVGSLGRRSLNKLFKRRYGESYSVDATIKKDPIVEAPDDDDDDDEGEDKDDDDDDDDDDEDKDDD